MSRLRSFLLAAMLSIGCAAYAQPQPQPQPQPFEHGDPAAGKTMADKDCVACHARRFDGSADRIYLRADRKVTTPAQLLAQVSYCNAQLGTNYFPEEEEHVAAYLNRQYYHFR